MFRDVHGAAAEEKWWAEAYGEQDPYEGMPGPGYIPPAFKPPHGNINYGWTDTEDVGPGTPIPADHPGRTPAYQHPDVILPGHQGWEDYHDWKPPAGSTFIPPQKQGPVNQFADDASGNPALWSSPMPGYIQFHPGGIVYELGSASPAEIQQNQHLYQDQAVTGAKWGQDFGYDPYIADRYVSFDNINHSPAELAQYGMTSMPSKMERERLWGKARAPIAPHSTAIHPYGLTYSEMNAYNEFRRNQAIDEIARRQAEQARYLGIGGYAQQGTSAYPGAWDSYAYQQQDPYDWSRYAPGSNIAEQAALGTYADVPVVSGEPTIYPDTTLSNPYIDIRGAGLEKMTMPTRTRLASWLRDLGYSGQGAYGDFGEESYLRPEGQTGPVEFTAADFALIEDPNMRSWIEWLMGRMGYADPIKYPGAVAA